MIKDKKIVFFGTPEFAIPSLNALRQEGYNIVLVITQPDKPAGRKQILTPTPVKVEAKKLKLRVIEDLKIERLKDLKPDIGIVVAYGKIISPGILNLFPDGCLNIHPSLLPKYRGPSPIQAAILNGDKETGITIIKLDEQMDHGEIISNCRLTISKNDTSKSLHDKLSIEAARLLIKTLSAYLAGKIKPKAQDHKKATYTRILKREDGKINWHKNAEEIERQIRAYYPWPGSYSQFPIRKSPALLPARPVADLPAASLWRRHAGGSKAGRAQIVRIKILSARIAEELPMALPGAFQEKNGQLYIRCGKGSLLIDKLQPAGKNEMFGENFIRGYLF